MNEEFNTVELARVYEDQGHFREALDIYKGLGGSGQDGLTDSEISRAVERLETALENSASQPKSPLDVGESGKRIEHLLEQWLRLLILRKRLSLFQKIRARF